MIEPIERRYKGLGGVLTSSFCHQAIAFWSMIVLAGAWGAIHMSLSTWHRYQVMPTVISMERDYKEWNTSFPAVTICPISKVDESLLEVVIGQEFPNEYNNEDMKEFVKELMNADYSTFSNIREYTGIRPDKFLSIIDETHENFSYSLSSSHSDVYGILDMVKSMTELGECYSFNSMVAVYSQISYWKNGKFSVVEQPEPFTGSPLDGDMFAQVMRMSSGYMLYIHGPYETFDIASKANFSPYMKYKTLELSALSIYSTAETRTLTIAQRKCRFSDESNLKLAPVYTYKLCRMQCRMQLALQFCRCVPHFYRPQKGYKICDVYGMHCLGKYHDVLIKLRDPTKNDAKMPCDCLPPCDDIMYAVESETTMEWFLGTNLKWGLVKYPRLRLKRDIIFGFTDLLVSIGGTAGLFLGCSVLSFIEFIYFFTLRAWFTWRKSSGKRRNSNIVLPSQGQRMRFFTPKTTFLH
ncbi:LOW QUALITY PROTEIN: sodium channel protein Nach-like [Nilaparvata lugens]|uniref:LOW QUALITY PROTEIN: sodium channel protein Nach-like n=1 Tax=Nilaparvata lugens TaxID=108931 RepID=UPI00193DA6FA|nr:LOW QUALITY PROTEIN: sodium channel protein Nach-like [Nilaparvata lugens]